MIEAGREVADALAGVVLTERQALVYVLRKLLEIDRMTAADAIGPSPSNVDNLQRRATETVADAERIVEGLAAVQGTVDEADSGIESTV